METKFFRVDIYIKLENRSITKLVKVSKKKELKKLYDLESVFDYFVTAPFDYSITRVQEIKTVDAFELDSFMVKSNSIWG